MQRATQYAETIVAANLRRRRWLRVAWLLMAIVAFWVTYAMILPAITMTSPAATQTLNCTYTVHTHTADCYDAAGQVTCGQADFVVHTHSADCYDSAGTLVCPLLEATPHTHTDACYNTHIVCGQQESATHTHTDACYTQVAVCGQSEIELHTHTASCYAATESDAQNTESVTSQDATVDTQVAEGSEGCEATNGSVEVTSEVTSNGL
jgi:hypothetical protein